MITQAQNFSLNTNISLEAVCTKMPHRTFRVWALVCMLGKGAKEIWIDQKELAERIHVSVSTVGRAIRDLIELEYLIPKEEKHEDKYRVYERKMDEEFPLRKRGPGGFSHEANCQTLNPPAPFSKGGCEIPRELIEQISLVKQKPLSPCKRTRHIAHVVIQFLPYNVTEGDEPLHFIVPPAMVPFGTFTPESENLDDLEWQFKTVMKEQKGEWALDGLKISSRMDILRRKRDGIPHQIGKGNRY